METPRLILRQWCDDDLDAWIAMCADSRVMEFLGPTRERERAVADAAVLRERLERTGYGWWALEIKASEAGFAGCVALADVPFEAHFTPVLEVGWRLSREAWGRGYATEGARAALAFAFETLARNEVVAMTAVVNVRSQRVMQRLGMTRDASDDFAHPRLERGDRLRPHVLYRLRRRSYFGAT